MPDLFDDLLARLDQAQTTLEERRVAAKTRHDQVGQVGRGISALKEGLWGLQGNLAGLVGQDEARDHAQAEVALSRDQRGADADSVMEQAIGGAITSAPTTAAAFLPGGFLSKVATRFGAAPATAATIGRAGMGLGLGATSAPDAFEQAYVQALAQGMSEDEARAVAWKNAAGSVVTETAASVLSPGGVEAAFAPAAKQTFSQALRRLPQTLGRAAIDEGLEEGLTEVAHIGLEQALGLNQDSLLADENAGRVGMSAASGAVMGPGFQAPGVALEVGKAAKAIAEATPRAIRSLSDSLRRAQSLRTQRRADAFATAETQVDLEAVDEPVETTFRAPWTGPQPIRPIPAGPGGVAITDADLERGTAILPPMDLDTPETVPAIDPLNLPVDSGTETVQAIQQQADQAAALGSFFDQLEAQASGTDSGETTAVQPVADAPGKVTTYLDTLTPEDRSAAEALLAQGLREQQPSTEATLANVQQAVVMEQARRDRAARQQKQQVAAAAKQVETAPTEAQKNAGNYQKGHLRANGFDITIENPKGSTRSGKDSSGKAWSVQMPAHYGYFKRTEGADGDQVDVYLGDDTNADTVFVVDQVDAKTGAFDEHKVLMGFPNAAEALRTYDAGFSDGKGPQRRGAFTAMKVDEFKAWLREGDTAKPLGKIKETPRAATAKTTTTDQAKATEPTRRVPDLQPDPGVAETVARAESEAAPGPGVADAVAEAPAVDDSWSAPGVKSTPEEAIRSLSRVSLWKRNRDAGEVDWNKRDAAWHIKNLGMTMPEFWDMYGDQITLETNRIFAEYEGHKQRTPHLDGLRKAFKEGESNYRINEILKYDLGVDLRDEMQVAEASAVAESELDKALKKHGLDPQAKPSKASVLRKKADELAKRAMAMTERIPGGQPVQSTRDANLRQKSQDLMRKASDLIRQAEELEAAETTTGQPQTPPTDDTQVPAREQPPVRGDQTGRASGGVAGSSPAAATTESRTQKWNRFYREAYRSQETATDDFEAWLKGELPAENLPPGVVRDDIPWSAAMRAHEGTSHTPDQRAAYLRKEYVDHMRGVWERVQRVATDSGREDSEAMQAFEEYRQGYLKHYMAYLGSRSGMVSVLVAGGSNFPAQRMEKKHRGIQKRLEELVQWDRRAQSRLMRGFTEPRTAEERTDVITDELKQSVLKSIGTLKSIEKDPAGWDRAAFSRNLAGKLERALANGHVRAVREALALMEERQAEYLKRPVLTKKHRIYTMLAKAEAKAEAQVNQPSEEPRDEFEGASLERDADGNRLRIHFDNRPGHELIADLKREGWRWSPRNSAWQRQLTGNAEISAKRILAKHLSKAQTLQAPDRIPGDEDPIAFLRTQLRGRDRLALTIGEASAAIRAVHDANEDATVIFGPMNSRVRARLEALGVDLKPVTAHRIDISALRHAMAHHSGATEAKRGQVPLTVDDLANIPAILDNPSDIQPMKDGFDFIGNGPDGTMVVTEVRSTKGSGMFMVTAYKHQDPAFRARSGAVDSRLSPSDAQGPEHNVRNEVRMTDDTGSLPDQGASDKLYQAERTPGDDAPLAMPDPAEGIESLISWALAERDRVIADLRKRRDRADEGMRDEYAATLAAYEGVDPTELAAHMRAFPGHYLRQISAKGGSMDPVHIFRQRTDLPPMEPRVPVSPVPPADPKGKPPDLRGTLKTLNANLKQAVPSAPTLDVDRGALPEGTAGEFDTRTGGVTLRYHNDLDLVAHEIGHWAGETFKLLPDVSEQDARAELSRLGIHGSPAKGETRLREGLAEFFRGWMVNPGEIERRAPTMLATTMREVPREVLDALRHFGDSVRQFEGAAPVRQIAAGVQATETATRDEKAQAKVSRLIIEGVAGLFGAGKRKPTQRPPQIPKRFNATVADKARFANTDKQAPQVANYLTSLALVGIDPTKVPERADWTVLRKQARGQAQALRDMVLRHGLARPDLSVATDPVTGERMTMGWLLDTIMTHEDWTDVLDRAHAYGVAERSLELEQRFTRQTEERIQTFAEARQLEAGDRFQKDRAAKEVEVFAKEQRAELRKRLARLTAAGGGLHSATETARKALADLEKDPQGKDIREYLRRYRAWSDFNLDYAVWSELLSPDQAQRIREANQYYIDWHRVFGEDDGPIQIGEAVQGSSRTIHNPLASLLHATWSVVNRGDANRLMQTFVGPLKMIPTGGPGGKVLSSLGHTISTEEAENAYQKQGGYHDDATGERRRVYRLQRLVQQMGEDGAPIFNPDNGQPMQTVETEHWVFDSGTEASIEAGRAALSDHPWMLLMQGLNSLQRNMITLSPGFRFKVPLRDNMERILNSEVGSGVSDIPAILAGKVDLDGRSLDELFALSGAGMAGWNQQTREQALAEVFDHVEGMRESGWKVLTPHGFLKWWQKIGEAAENIARKQEFATAYRKARADGKTEIDAALNAMTHARALLDTAESGYVIGKMNGLALFLNAAIKGMQKSTKMTRMAIKAYAAGEVETGNRLAAAVSMRMMVWGGSLAALRLLKLALFDGDEDKEREELTQPAWKRDFSIQIDVPGFPKIAIPKPYEWGWVGSGFERLADYAWAKHRGWDDHAKRAFEGYGKSFLGAVSPVDEGTLAGSFAPLIEVLANHSFFRQGTIIPEYEAKKDLDLRSGQASASPLGRLLATVVPADARNLDHLVRGYFGGFGSMATARDWSEFLKRATGYSGETSIYSSRDVSWVLDYADRRGTGSSKPVRSLRDLLRSASKADGEERERLEAKARALAEKLRGVMERAPKKAPASP